MTRSETWVVPFLVPRRKVWLTPTARVPCRNAANIGQRKTWTQSKFCRISLGTRAPDMYYSVPAQETAKHRTKFGCPPLSDVGAVTKPRRNTRWNLLGCPKLANRFQPLVGRSSPCYKNMWRGHWDISDLHSKFALRPRHGSMVGIPSQTTENRQRKKKTQQDENRMSASATQSGHKERRKKTETTAAHYYARTAKNSRNQPMRLRYCNMRSCIMTKRKVANGNALFFVCVPPLVGIL